jgi:transcriptional regulator
MIHIGRQELQMYLQPHFKESRTDVMQRLVRAHPLATFVTAANGKIVVNHMPLLLSSESGQFGVLRGHMPRANPVSQAFDGGNEAVAIFQGPEAYVSPSWYPSKHEHGKALPTWNYAVVHAHGCPRVVDDADWVLKHLTDLTNEHEARQLQPWQVSDAPRSFTEQMIKQLVGIEMPIHALVGKWKVSQNRPAGDRLGVAAALREQGGDAALAMEALVMEHASND